MTTLKQAARQAIEDFDSIVFHSERRIPDKSIEVIAYSAIAKLRQALEQPKQEPVAWISGKSLAEIKDFDATVYGRGGFDDATPIYTEPPKREWVGLKEEDISAISKKLFGSIYDAGSDRHFASAIEAKLKERNT